MFRCYLMIDNIRVRWHLRLWFQVTSMYNLRLCDHQTKHYNCSWESLQTKTKGALLLSHIQTFIFKTGQVCLCMCCSWSWIPKEGTESPTCSLIAKNFGSIANVDTSCPTFSWACTTLQPPFEPICDADASPITTCIFLVPYLMSVQNVHLLR